MIEMMIEGRVIRVGNSAAIAVSKKLLEERNWKWNQKVELVELRRNKDKLLAKMFGSAKGAKPFTREEADREL